VTLRLEDLLHCFQGVSPCMVATCAADGTPNVTFVSQLYFVDSRRVALSCQFFNKTRRNLEANPRVCVEVHDPITMEAYRFDLRYSHSETSGPLFDKMAVRIQAIASHTGMAGVFRLLSADVLDVLSVEQVAGYLTPADPDETPASTDVDGGPLSELRGLQVITDRVCRAHDLDELLTSTLESLEQLFGFHHAYVLMPGDAGRLVTIASRGYGDAGIGAEIAIGDGLIGTAARERRLVRVAGVPNELRYGRAIRERVSETGGGATLRPEIPLPGLPDAQSQMALPLVVEDHLVGVLVVEGTDPLAFDDWHEAFLQIVGNQIAMGIARMLDDDDDGGEPVAPGSAAPAPAPAPRRFTFYRHDDCVFVDDEYLVRNVPGKILWKLLTTHQREGRREFSNRELRLDPWLGLPPLKDNLESRLILLRRRLEEKCPDVRLVPVRRGRFALELACPIELCEKDAG